VTRRLAIVALVLAVSCAGSGVAAQPLPEPASGWSAKTVVERPHAMVVAAHPLAAAAGLRMLRAGGNAIDAAVATVLVLGLVEPQSSGIGGGGFLLHHDARSGRLVAYDGRETAPAAARPDRFVGADGRPVSFGVALAGGRAVGVPGTMRMLELAHRAHGRLPWRALFAPAIELAEQGFAVSPRLHALIAAETRFRQPRIRAYFLDPDGRPLAVGARLRNPAYAATLRVLAAEGGDALYRGAIASDIVDTVAAAAGGRSDLTLADLAGYRAIARAPLCGPYRGHRVCGPPAPSSGASTVLAMLGLLAPYDVSSMGPATFWSVHFVSEAGRLAYADRVYVADPAFVPPLRDLVDPDYLRMRSTSIRVDGSLQQAEPGTPPARSRAIAYVDGAAPERPSTSQVSIVDARGNAVSLTNTIEDAFGSRLMTAGGFLLNNELTDFAFEPTSGGMPVANRVEGGKRPRSSLAPLIVYDARGRVFMVVGSPGGPAIINYVAKAIVGVLDWHLDAQAAVDLPNFGSRNGPTELEAGTAVEALAPRLRALGHDVRILPHPSGLHAIVRTPRGWQGGADPRREGVAVGW
jgi:gamma-glutamyltranspeptidase/glutathione hydrolase